jgi:TonB family protein
MGLQGPEKKKSVPWGPMLTSYGVQTVALLALLVLAEIAPRIAPVSRQYVDLVAPNLNFAPHVTPAKTPPPVAKPVVRRIEPLRITPSVAPKIEAPVLDAKQPQRLYRDAAVAAVEPPKIDTPRFDSRVLNALPGPKAPSKIIALNTMGGSSAVPTLPRKAPSQVQTGGFGDPNGVPVNPNAHGRANIAVVGAFDLPAGGGYGNGTGGTKGARGTVASAGFGNGVAVQGDGGRGGSAAQGRIQGNVFPSAMASPMDTNPEVRTANRPPKMIPVSIQSKPMPVYTPEARQLGIEGEVLVKVLFAADGQIRVLNVVRGLGHGLDEAAQRAAQGVRFSPAQRDGHPVDTEAILRIVFQLS